MFGANFLLCYLCGKQKKQIMMKTTTTYSPMTACRNPKVSARNVAEYLVVPNIMLPTNQPIHLLYSESDFIRWGDMPARCVACDASCRFTSFSLLVFRSPHSSILSFVIQTTEGRKNLGNTKKGKHQEGKRGCYRDSSLHFVPF